MTMEVKIGSQELSAADLGAENPLPVLRQAVRDVPELRLKEDIPPEDRKAILENWVWRRLLPYRLQDGYSRQKRKTVFKTVVLENEYLRATFWVNLGGRLISLYDKEHDRELLDANPVFQPANLALRDAWFSGGIEWNPSNPGHHYHTCDPVFAARVEGPRGEPILRIYEWDRVKCFPWQVDFYLPAGSRLLFARVRLINPHDYELPMYWWTNMAVPQEAGSRVIAPAESAIYNSAHGELSCMPLPCLDGEDITYPTNNHKAREYFFRVPEDRRRWVASLDRNGTGFVQTSTDRLKGRKLFVWGESAGGNRWQEYLSEPGRAYIEIQAGLTRTQFETVPMAGKSEWAWTEAFGYLEAEAEKVHCADLQEARRTVEESLEAMLGRNQLVGIDELLSQSADRRPTEILNMGGGWAALERLRCARQGQGDPIPSGLMFDESTLGPEQQPWVELLETGKLPQSAVDRVPLSWMVQSEWGELIRQSVRRPEGDTWLTWLHLGLVEHEAGDPEAARRAWNRSIELVENGWAYRNLGALEMQTGKLDESRAYYEKAWSVGPQLPPLAEEYLDVLHRLKDYAAMDEFIRSLPEEIRSRERVHIASALASLELGRLEGIERIFEREFITIREGEETLTDIWFRYHAVKLARSLNRPVDETLMEKVRSECVPPKNINYRMFSENQ